MAYIDLQILNGKVHPYQPSFIIDSENYMEYWNKELADSSIALFYQFKIDSNHREKVFIVPDACTDLVFACDKNNPHAIVGGTVVKVQKFSSHVGEQFYLLPGTEYFNIKFLPGAYALFSDCSESEIVNKTVKLNDTLTNGQYLAEMIAGKSDFNSRVEAFLHYLKKNKRNYVKSKDLPLIIDYILRRINEKSGQISISYLSNESGYSSRYLDKMFEKYMGISPKLYCRIVRFQTSLKYLFSNTGESNTQIALKLGYYDQAHFLHEFRDFCSLTPNQLFEKSKTILK